MSADLHNHSAPPVLPLKVGRTRVHIVGGPGSGKTTLAQTLSSCLDVPSYSLDVIAFEGREFRLRPLEARLADIHRIAASPGWVTEGMWLGWTDELFQRADAIVWLDHVPTYLAGWRMVTRFLRGGLQEIGRQPWPRKFTRVGDFSRNLRLFVCAFQSGMQFYQRSSSSMNSHEGARTITRAETARDLLAHKSRVIHCRRESDIQAFLQNISAVQRFETPAPTVFVQDTNGT